MVELLSQPNCNPCRGTEKFLKDNGVAYVKRDVTEDPEALQKVVDLGYKGTPVVITDNGHWTGLNLQKLRELI